MPTTRCLLTSCARADSWLLDTYPPNVEACLGPGSARILDRSAIAAYRGGMTVKLDLNPEVEAGLVAQAQARGLSLEAYLQQVLKERSATPMPLRLQGMPRRRVSSAHLRRAIVRLVPSPMNRCAEST